MCDQHDPDELFARIDASIDGGHWHLIAVDDGDRPPWAYTIGLSERFGHPELVVVGSCSSCAGVLLNAVGDQIADGRSFVAEVDTPVEIDDLDAPVRFRSVHPRHWRTDRFAMWQAYYEGKPWRPPVAEAIQVVFVDRSGWFQDDPRSGRWAELGLDRAPCRARAAAIRS